MGTQETLEITPFSLQLLDIFQFDTSISDLFSLQLKLSLDDEDEDDELSDDEDENE